MGIYTPVTPRLQLRYNPVYATIEGALRDHFATITAGKLYSRIREMREGRLAWPSEVNTREEKEYRFPGRTGV